MTKELNDHTWDGPYEMRSEEQLQKIAEEYDCDLLIADESMLLLDLDSEKAVDQFHRMIEEIKDTVKSRVDIEDYEVLESRGGNWHGVVTLGTPIEEFPQRIALQAILGSDPLREFLLLTEYMLCNTAVNCLFRPRG